jgi:hypothetical protein
MNNKEFEIDGNRVICKKLSVTQYPNGTLGGPKKAEFFIQHRYAKIAIAIEQCGCRKIIISVKKELDAEKIFDIYQTLEKLLMLFEGSFFPVSEFQFSDSSSSTPNELQSLSDKSNRYKLSYYNSVDFLRYRINKLIDIFEVNIEELFLRWEELISELDIVHQVILYSLANNGLTADLRCAFLIESAEPLVELIKTYKKYFSSLKPGERGTTLKMCLDAIITKYGDGIFGRELSCNYDKMLSIFVESRNRIMHIKKEQTKQYLSGVESILYAEKLFCLYRRVLFELLGIDYLEYQNNLKAIVSCWEKSENVMDNFLIKLKTLKITKPSGIKLKGVGL